MLFDTKDSPSKTLYSGVFEGESLAVGKDPSAVGAACFPLRPRDAVFGSEREVYWRCVESHVWKASVYSHTSSRESRCPDCYVETKDWLADSPLVQIWHPTKNLPRVPENGSVQQNILVAARGVCMAGKRERPPEKRWAGIAIIINTCGYL